MKYNHRALSYVYLFITATIWGFAGPIIKYTLEFFPPSVFLTYRFGISTIVALLWFAMVPFHFPQKTKNMPVILLYGFLTSTAALGFLFLGFNKTTAITGSIFSALSPIMITAAGAMILREHVTAREKIGIGIALLGTIIIIVEPLIFAGSGNLGASLEGNMYHIVALVIAVANSLLAKIILRDEVNPTLLTHISFIVGFITMLPLMFLNHTAREIFSLLTTVPLSGHLGVLYMALMSGTLAYTLWHLGQKSIEIGEASLFTYLHPVFTAPLSLFWLSEPITPIFVAGACVITAGVILAEWRKSLGLSRIHTKRQLRKRR